MKHKLSKVRLEKIINRITEITELIAYDGNNPRKDIKKLRKKVKRQGVEFMLKKGEDLDEEE